MSIAVLTVGPFAHAKSRLMRVFDWRSGLPVSFVGAIEQDPSGFLWIASSGGVFRYDGTEMVRQWPIGVALVPGSATSGAPLRTQSRSGVLDVFEANGAPVVGPDGKPLRAPFVCVASDGALWTATGGTLHRRTPEGAWSAARVLPDGDQSRVNLSNGRDGSIFVYGGQRVYRVDAAGAITIVATLRGALQALDRADGSTAIGCFPVEGGRVYELKNGVVREIDRYGTRFMALAERQGVLWIAYDSSLVRLAAGRPRESIEAADGLLSGGSMLVDAEGSLWIGSFRGLIQFPEPDTTAWQREAPALGMQVLRVGEYVWMSAWSMLVVVRADGRGGVVEHLPATVSAPCADGAGSVWVGGTRFTRDRATGRWGHRHQADLGWVLQCASSPRGGVWLPAASGLFHVAAGAQAPRLWATPAAPGAPFSIVYEDRDGTLWAARGGEICSTRVGEQGSAIAPNWSCSTLPASISGMLQMESGAMWAATFDQGVWRLRDRRWEPIAASAAMNSTWTTNLRPSLSGGTWIVGEGNFLRVRERGDLADGWEVLERIGAWQGLPTSGVFDVFEEPDGTLWAATNLSLVKIDPSARGARPAPPPVLLVDAASDGKPFDLTRAAPLQLPYDRNRLELRFAALSYRDPALIRYRTRLGPDDAWSAPTNRPNLRFVDLPAKRYRVQVEASLDGVHWSSTPAEVTFEVLPAWYATWWARALATVLVAAALFASYRLRVAAVLRTERQRMRIAMDLHDEVGSGLGSIGVLAGLLARPELPVAQRHELSTRIVGVARELSQSLGDIVWSLRAGSGSLDSLWVKLLDRAQPLFASGQHELRAEAPDPLPSVALSLATRRNVFLMATEALYNAARHAGAARVSLRLVPEGAFWLLEIADDGQGLPTEPPTPTRRGLGLEAMRIRAEEIGASIRWESPEGGGTRVVIRFRP